jgi:hypothetical protein
MNNLIDSFDLFLNEAGDALSDSAVRNQKIDSMKEKIKKGMENANKSRDKAQDLLQKGDADAAGIENLKYRKALAAVGIAQIDYKLFMASEALKAKKEAEKARNDKK